MGSIAVLTQGAAGLLDGSANLLAMAYVQGAGVGPQTTFANTTSGDYLPSAQSTLGSGFIFPLSVAVDAGGNVFVVDSGDGSAVKEIVAAGGYVTVNTLGSGIDSLYGVAVDGSGNVYIAAYCIADNGCDAVKEIDRATPPTLGFATTVLGLTSIDSPQTVTVQNIGNARLALSALSYPTDFPEASGVDTDCTASSVVAEGTSCTLSIDFTPQPSSLIGTSTALSESVDLTTDSLNATTAQSLGVSGTVTAAPASLTSPAPNTVLAGPTVTFNWSSGAGATDYRLVLGTSVEANNVWGTGPPTVTFATPTNLPTNGETIYARLYTYYGSTEVYADCTFTAAATP